MKKIILFFSLITAMPLGLQAQELNAKVVVNGTAVQNTVDLKVFKALEQGLQDFLNKRKWTNDEYTSAEKIDCQFNVTITKRSKEVADAYEAKLSIQASRPVYQSDYLSPLINYVDKDFGTGCLKVTPAHDTNDYELGRKYNLPSIDLFNDNGTLNEHGAHFAGKDRFDVRKEISENQQFNRRNIR